MTADADKLEVYLQHTTWDDFDEEYKQCYSRNGREGKCWASVDRPYWLIHKDADNERAHWTKCGYTPDKQDVYTAIRNKKLAEMQKLEHCTHTWLTEPYLTMFKSFVPTLSPFTIQPLPEVLPVEQTFTITDILNDKDNIKWKRTAQYLQSSKEKTIKCPTHKKNDQPCPTTCTHKSQWTTGVPISILDKIEHSLNQTRLREDQRKQQRKQKRQKIVEPPVHPPASD